MAFKDLGMCLLAEIMHYFLEQSNCRRTVLVGTSGDSGPAALWACRGKPRIDVVVLYPLGRVSRVQEGQMLRAVRSDATTAPHGSTASACPHERRLLPSSLCSPACAAATTYVWHSMARARSSVCQCASPGFIASVVIISSRPVIVRKRQSDLVINVPCTSWPLRVAALW